MRLRNRRLNLILMVVLTLVMLPLVSGCGLTSQNASPFVSIGADAGTIGLLSSIKNPADQKQAAQVAYDAAAAVYAATGNPPDYTAAQTLIADEIAKWNSPYAPLVLAVVDQAIAQAQANSTATPSVQQTQANAFLNASMLGVELGALQYGAVPPASTQPATTQGA